MKSNKQKPTKFINDFSDLYAGSPWYGNSLMKILGNVKSSVALFKPNKASHSIIEIVSHIVYWRMAIINQIEHNAERGSMKNPDNWMHYTNLKRKGWKAILNELDNSQTQLIAVLNKNSNSNLKKMEYAENISMFQAIEGLYQHDLYHTGQIAYIKSLNEMKKAAR